MRFSWGSPAHYRALRNLVVLMWVVRALATPYSDFAGFFPHATAGFGLGTLFVAAPIGPLLFQGEVLNGLRWLVVGLGAVLVMARNIPRWAHFIFLIAIVTLDSVSRSIGSYASHAQVIPLLLLGMVVLTWKHSDRGASLESEYSPDLNRVRRNSYTRCWYAMAIVSIVYGFIGIERLSAGGIGLFRSPALYEYIADSSAGGDALPQWLWRNLDANVLSAGFALTTVVECIFPVVLFLPRLRRPWLLTLLSFHLSTFGLMNILFAENILVLALLLWPPLHVISKGGAYKLRAAG